MTTIELSNGIILKNVEEMIRDYYRNERYIGYDESHDENNAITRENIDAANKLDARIREQVAQNIIQSKDIKVALTSIKNKELNKINDGEWKDYKNKIFNVFRSACSIRGVRIPVATKILHLKRPKLIPILDRKVMNYLSGIKSQYIRNKDKLIRIGIEVIEKIREDIIRNEKTFNELQETLADLPYSLTNIRLYDIIIWKMAKEDDRENINASLHEPKI